MNDKYPAIFTPDPWMGLRQFTEARIALGRCGSSLPLKETMKFKLAHARAKDAVHQPAQMELLSQQLKSAGYSTLQLSSNVADREEYLTRPDKGRCLVSESKQLLEQQAKGYDIGIVICDGLSAPAIHQSAASVASTFLDIIKTTNLTTSPVCLVKNGRVAIGDEIGSIFGVKIIVVLIGERPGLSSPNSLGAYLTFNPSPGTTDEARNCISNIRAGGMTIADAVQKISYFVEIALKKKKTGIEVKDRMTSEYLPMASLLLR